MNEAEQAVAKIREGLDMLRAEAIREKKVGDLHSEKEGSTGPQHQALAIAYLKAVLNIEPTIISLETNIELAVTPHLR